MLISVYLNKYFYLSVLYTVGLTKGSRYNPISTKDFNIFTKDLDFPPPHIKSLKKNSKKPTNYNRSDHYLVKLVLWGAGDLERLHI